MKNGTKIFEVNNFKGGDYLVFKKGEARNINSYVEFELNLEIIINVMRR